MVDEATSADAELRGRLHHRSIPWIAALTGLGLNLPTLWMGLISCDFLLLAHVRTQLTVADAPGRWWEMFGVPSPGPEAVASMIRMGILPWWTDPAYSASMLRPLSAATHFLDHLLWPHSALLMHAHSVLWYGALALAVGFLYRRISGPGILAALAALMYAVDESHADGVAWLAGRNTVITALWAVLVLTAHDSFRRRGWKPGAWLAPLAMIAALCSSEGGIAVWGYLLAHALFLDTGPALRRGLSLLPILVVTLAWALVYRQLGYGIYGGEAYLDPIADPLLFANMLPGRLLNLLHELLALPASLFGVLSIDIDGPLRTVSAALAISLGLCSCWLARRSSAVRFWLFATVVSCIPFCAAPGGARLLFLPSMGSAALLAEVVIWTASLARLSWREGAGQRIWGGLLLTATLVVHVPLAAWLSPQMGRGLSEVARAFANTMPTGQAVAHKTIFMLNTPSYFLSSVNLLNRESGKIHPRGFYMLGASVLPVRLERIGPASIVLEPEGGYLLEPSSTMVRSSRVPFVVGQRHVLGNSLLTVTSLTSDGRPSKVRVDFSADELANAIWLTWKGWPEAYEEIQLPALGKQLILQPKKDPIPRMLKE